jgi:hypothetical protein
VRVAASGRSFFSVSAFARSYVLLSRGGTLMLCCPKFVFTGRLSWPMGNFKATSSTAK